MGACIMMTSRAWYLSQPPLSCYMTTDKITSCLGFHYCKMISTGFHLCSKMANQYSELKGWAIYY